MTACCSPLPASVPLARLSPRIPIPTLPLRACVCTCRLPQQDSTYGAATLNITWICMGAAVLLLAYGLALWRMVRHRGRPCRRFLAGSLRGVTVGLLVIGPSLATHVWFVLDHDGVVSSDPGLMLMPVTVQAVRGACTHGHSHRCPALLTASWFWTLGRATRVRPHAVPTTPMHAHMDTVTDHLGFVGQRDSEG